MFIRISKMINMISIFGYEFVSVLKGGKVSFAHNPPFGKLGKAISWAWSCADYARNFTLHDWIVYTTQSDIYVAELLEDTFTTSHFQVTSRITASICGDSDSELVISDHWTKRKWIINLPAHEGPSPMEVASILHDQHIVQLNNGELWCTYHVCEPSICVDFDADFLDK